MTTQILIFLLTINALYTQLIEGTFISPKENHTFCSNNSTCPTWFICDNGNKCQCGNQHHKRVVCDVDNLRAGVLDCYCITQDKNTGSTYLGACFYNCENPNKINKYSVYRELPKNPKTLLNNSVCTDFYRTGLLCGDCEDGYSPLVLSYNLSCIKCPDGHKNWWKFIIVAFVPLTFFYFFIVLLNINITSSHLHGVVYFSQIVSISEFVRILYSASRNSNQHYLIGVKIYLFFCSFWNLDLFRFVTPDICLNLTTLQSLALDYLLALYPFVLILLSYIFIYLYDRKVVCIVTLWKPFHRILTLFRKSWDVRTSVIDSFSTFFLLSHVKILSVSADLLIPTQIYQLGSNTSTFGLYYSPSVTYFGAEHRPYAIMAIAILTLFVIVPSITLFLYSFQFFQKFLSFFPINWHFLHAFVDSFQGCYKDGTEPGTFDCRWFSVIALLIRPILFITYILTLSAIFHVYASVIIAIYVIAMINIQPFKKVANRYPSTDIIFLIFLILYYVVNTGSNNTNKQYAKILLMFVTASISVFALTVYTVLLMIFWLLSRLKRKKIIFLSKRNEAAKN